VLTLGELVMPEGMKPMAVILFIVIMYVTVSIIANNAQAWALYCNGDLTCNVPFTVLSPTGPLTAILTGHLDLFWSGLGVQYTVTNGTTCVGGIPYWSFSHGVQCITASGLLMMVLGLFGAGMLIFVALGLHVHIEAATVAVEFGSSGDQPAKLAQSLAIGVMIWGGIVLVFGGWESQLSHITPGLGGTFLGIITLAYAIALVWFTQSRQP
jgi:hypothetical protein